ncbi:MAG TPA: HNH endonuclease family protein [Actinotalea sp.]|jgi:hypothetical protein
MRRRQGRPPSALPWLTLTLFGLVVLGVGIPLASDAAETTTYTVPAAELTVARAALDGLPVKGRAPATGYSREQFGQAWADVDRNGCDTRNDVLRRDLTAVVLKPGTNGCVVLTGTLADPYSGTAIRFARGEHSDAVQIDHVVALSEAWQTGAQQLSAEQRQSLANDPANLLAVDGPLNQEKGAADAATWLPPNKGFRCAYVMRQVTVKAAYRLWVTPAEHDAIERQLDGCVTSD